MAFGDEVRPYLTALRGLGTDGTEHSNRSLYEHLVGVSRLLYDWGNPRQVWLAGLYHSVYGTSTFKIRTVSPNYRSKVVDLIGTDAEKIVYVYCSIDRAALLLEAAKAVPSSFEGAVLGTEIRDQLIELLAADRVEQLASRGVVPDNDHARLHLTQAGLITFRAAAHCLSPAARLVLFNARSQIQLPGSQ